MGQLFRGGGSSALHGVTPVQGATRLVSPRRRKGGDPIDADTTLAYRFTDGTLDPVVGTAPLTFTRASTATYYDATGALQTAAIDGARFDHDPISKVPLGLLIEEARTNLFLNSDAPVTQGITTVADTYTISAFGPGSVTMSGTGVGVASAGSPLTVACAAGTLTCTVAGGPDRVQVELGGFSSSYIPTVGSTVTRAQDRCFTTDVTWYDALKGTYYAQATPIALESQGITTEISDGTNLQRWLLGQRAPPNQTDALLIIASTVTRLVYTPSNQWAAGVPSKLALAAQNNDGQAAMNGLTSPVENFLPMPAGISRMDVGAQRDGTLPMNGWIQVIAFANVRKDENFLAELTKQ